MEGRQIYMLSVLAIAMISIVLLATLTDGEHILTVIVFLGGWLLPSPAGGGGRGGPSGKRRRPSSTSTRASESSYPVDQRLALVPCLALALLVAGCGGSALSQHATAAASTFVALETAGGFAKATASDELAECADDACAAEVGERWAWTVALDVAAVATQLWIDALETMHLAGGNVSAAVELAARRAFDRLEDAVAILRREMHELPPWLDGAITGARVAVALLLGVVLPGAPS